MSKLYEVSVFEYPKVYTVRADNEEEARTLGKAKFYEEENKSVFDTEVNEVEENE